MNSFFLEQTVSFNGVKKNILLGPFICLKDFALSNHVGLVRNLDDLKIFRARKHFIKARKSVASFFKPSLSNEKTLSPIKTGNIHILCVCEDHTTNISQFFKTIRLNGFIERLCKYHFFDCL